MFRSLDNGKQLYKLSTKVFQSSTNIIFNSKPISLNNYPQIVKFPIQYARRPTFTEKYELKNLQWQFIETFTSKKLTDNVEVNDTSSKYLNNTTLTVVSKQIKSKKLTNQVMEPPNLVKHSRTLQNSVCKIENKNLPVKINFLYYYYYYDFILYIICIYIFNL